MKIKLLVSNKFVKNNTLKDLFRVMRVTLILLFVLSFQLVAENTKGQDAIIKLKNNQVSVRQLINEIEKQTDYLVVYSTREVNTSREINLKNKSDKVSEYLNQTFNGTDIGYDFENNYIVLSRKESNNKALEILGTRTTQQTGKTITGTIADINGNPVIGATVVVQGDATKGTVTDVDGKYRLINVPDKAVLDITYVGMRPQSVPTEGRTTINITLEEDMALLDEVVVVGYGVMRKRDVLGAISTVKTDDLSLATSSSIASALGGKAAGLLIRQNSAQPGGGLDIVIRGQGSVNASNDPLIIIDGFPISNLEQPGSGNRYDSGTTSILNSFNPNDIESVEVLKDASSTAIYGARAANGVILITTKRGETGKPNIEYSNNFSYQKKKNSFDVLPLNEWMQVRNEAAWEDWNFQNRVYPYGPRTLEEAKANPVGADFRTLYTQKAIDNVGRGTDWFDLVTRNGFINQHNISLNGGSEATKYLISANYFNHRGIIKNSGIERFSFRTNIDQKINNYAKLELSLTGSRVNNDNTQLGSQQWENSGIIRAAIQQGPHILAIDENGNYPINPQLATQPNPYSLLTISDKGRVDRLLTNLSLDITPIKDLVVKFKVGFDRGIANRWTYLPKTTLSGALENGKASINQNDNNDLLQEVTANYVKKIEEAHTFNFMIGVNRQKTYYENKNSGNTNFITDAFLWNNLNAGTGTKTVGSSRVETAFASYFGRFFYNYKDRYLVTASIRRDGASVFSKNNKWGTFPSISVGWNLAEEPFLSNHKDIFSQLKFRLGYGQTGNASIGSSAFAAYMAYPGWVSGSDNPLIAVSAIRLENPDLKWETTTEGNIGLDFSLFNSRISGSIDVFNRIISDLLAIKPINSYHEINSVIANIGKTQSKGFEFTLSGNIINQKDFSWTSTLNLSRFDDRWKERAPDWKPAVYESVSDPIRAIYSRISDGIMQIGEVVPAQPQLIPGQIKIKDIDGYKRDDLGNPVVDANGRFIRTGAPDGIIDDADTRLLGTYDPGLIAGLTNRFTYKNINLSFQLNGMFNRIISDPNYIAYGVSADGLYTYGYNALRTVKDRWTPENPSTTHPSSFYGWSPYGSGNFFFEKGWFIRLQNITLSYTLPKEWIKSITSASLYLSSDNLFVITPYGGVDPETDSYTAAYPNVKIFTVGMNVRF